MGGLKIFIILVFLLSFIGIQFTLLFLTKIFSRRIRFRWILLLTAVSVIILIALFRTGWVYRVSFQFIAFYAFFAFIAFWILEIFVKKHEITERKKRRMRRLQDSADNI